MSKIVQPRQCYIALNLKKKDLSKPQIGIGTIWYESNPCNSKLNIASKYVKKSFNNTGYLPFQFSSVGVSDGITMGTEGMCYSLPSRELIADSFETIVNAHHYDGLICIPGCDKNLPGVLMAMCRVNRPSFIIYGGSMPPSLYNGKELDIVSSFEGYGSLLKGDINEFEYDDLISHCCNKNGGSCSGLYTANTMASLFEVMGLTQINSSSYPANSTEKMFECLNSVNIMDKCMKEDIKTTDILTDISFENAIKMLYCTGGSTNAIIHLLAIANELDINLDIEKFNEFSNIPVLLNMKPHGKNMMYHLHKMGGMSIFIQYLIENNILNGNQLTITGKTLEQNVIEYNKKYNNIFNYKELLNHIEKFDKKCELFGNSNVITKLENPFKKNNHIRILKGNIAKNGCVTKIYNDEVFFSGKVLVYDSEQEMINALNENKISINNIIVIRGQGERTGCPEMLSPTSALVGYFGKHTPPLLTDGRFSGGSKGILVAHLDDMYKHDSIVGYIENGDIINFDLKNNSINLDISNSEIDRRKYFKNIKYNKYKKGYLNIYSKYVGNINNGFIIE